MSKDRQEDRLPSWGKMFSYFLLLGFINVGGPVAQITIRWLELLLKHVQLVDPTIFGLLLLDVFTDRLLVSAYRGYEMRPSKNNICSIPPL